MKERADLRYRRWMLNEGIVRGLEFSTLATVTADKLAKALEEGNQSEADTLRAQLMKEYSMFADKDYNREVDKKVAKEMMREYISLVPEENLPGFFSLIYSDFGGNSDRFVDFLFNRSLFGNEINIQNFNEGEVDAETIMNDPMFLFSKSVAEESASLEKQLAVFDAPFAIARKAYLEGILSMDGPYAYFPDANLTLRLSYGQVKGYKPGDAIYYAHQTTSTGG